jgi:hypothetical protein
MSDYKYAASPPEWVPELPREYDTETQSGEVVEEVGVIQQTGDTTYWKALQRIEVEDGPDEIRACYYTKDGDSAQFQRNPMSLPEEPLTELVSFAEGKIL